MLKPLNQYIKNKHDNDTSTGTSKQINVNTYINPIKDFFLYHGYYRYIKSMPLTSKQIKSKLERK